MSKLSVSNLEDTLKEHIPADKLREVKTVMFGGETEPLRLSEKTEELGREFNFEVKGYKIPCAKEQLRAPRIVRVAAVQNSIVEPTDAPIKLQYQAICNKLAKIIEAAAASSVNILCLQEAWTAPFFFCTREKDPWCEFAECAETGQSFHFLSPLAKKYNMVIVSSILERDLQHNGIIWNTTVFIGNNGNYIGKHRKNHIPRVGDFNEATYYSEGNTGHPVFETAFGKIASNICYGRHHPLNWHVFGLNGAEIVFNPSATVGELSEPMWAIEARNAAIANSYYTVGINRVGTEVFQNEFTSGDGKPAHKAFGHFYGSSYIAAPNALRTPSLSRDRDGLLITDLDLNMCRQVKDRWMFSITGRPELYAKALTRYARHDFKPQVISDPSLRRAKL
eukprot:TRINITY_DN11904_c3_g1_i1.p1 TRINITY_DN11904_c3_g1~~TRINITY_DN11904_c3_g1_i1.p1  ORF type:complete len:393 (+),score=77.07 TRINITY_DN11904_c3_g1_i1:81-1259(+)